MAKFIFSISTGIVGSEKREVIEIPDDQLEGLSAQEREQYIQEEYMQWVGNNAYLEWWEDED
jgi:hypothetical protein